MRGLQPIIRALVEHKWKWLALLSTATAVAMGYALLAAWNEFTAFQRDNYELLHAAGAEQQRWLDLRAQQNMAEIAYGMLLVSIVGTIVSVVGVLAVTLTLWQNRKMIEATREIGQSQTKAYVFPIDGRVRLQGDPCDLHIRLRVRNAGATPALYVTTRGEIMRLGQQDPDLVSLKPQTVIILSDEVSEIDLYLRHEDFRTWLDPYKPEGTEFPPPTSFTVFGSIQYVDVFGVHYMTGFIVNGEMPTIATVERRLRMFSGGAGAFLKQPKKAEA